MRIKKIQLASTFLRSHAVLFLFFFIFIILRLPSLFEPHWYGDEGIYASVAYALEHGRKLYVNVFDNRLPGIYYLYSLASSENRLISIRIFNLVAGLISLAGIYALTLRLKFKRVVVLPLIIATWMLGTPLIEANIANTENFFLPFTIWGTWYALANIPKKLFIAGILFGCSFLVKFPPVFTFVAVGVYLLNNNTPLRKKIHMILTYGFGFMLPIFVVFILLFFVGNLKEAVQFGLMNNTSYITYYSQQVLSPQIKTLVLCITLFMIVILYMKEYISDHILILCILLTFDYYAAIFSGRRYEHYLQQIVPSLSLWSGYIALSLLQKQDVLKKVALVCLFFLVIFAGKFLFYQGTGVIVAMNVPEYYKEFLLGVSSKSYTSFLPFKFFNESAKLKIAKSLTRKYNTSNIFFYTDESWIYDYTQTIPPTFYVASYHQFLVPNGLNRLVNELRASNTDHVVIDRQATLTKQLSDYLNSDYNLTNEDDFFQYFQRK